MKTIICSTFACVLLLVAAQTSRSQTISGGVLSDPLTNATDLYVTYSTAVSDVTFSSAGATFNAQAGEFLTVTVNQPSSDGFIPATLTGDFFFALDFSMPWESHALPISLQVGTLGLSFTDASTSGTFTFSVGGTSINTTDPNATLSVSRSSGVETVSFDGTSVYTVSDSSTISSIQLTIDNTSGVTTVPVSLAGGLTLNPTAAAVPEPATLTLAALGGIAGALKLRRK